jgi:hypothetical protein
MDLERRALEDAEAQLYRRIQELRAQARAEAVASASGGRGPGNESDTPVPPPAGEANPPRAGNGESHAGGPGLEELIARAERGVDDLRATAATLEQTLPSRLEQVLERALAGHGNGRGIAELRDLVHGLSHQIEQVNRDVLSERLGRIEDLELMLDLFSTGISSVRQDVSALAGTVERIAATLESAVVKLDQPLQVTVERPANHGVRDLFKPTD